jgi:uncharacterized membrane protein
MLHNCNYLLHHSHIKAGTFSIVILYAYLVKKQAMEKRLLGIILSVLGIVGLIYAGVSFMNGGSGIKNIKTIIFTGVLGAIFFFSGITLISNTKDKAT